MDNEMEYTDIELHRSNCRYMYFETKGYYSCRLIYPWVNKSWGFFSADEEEKQEVRSELVTSGDEYDDAQSNTSEDHIGQSGWKVFSNTWFALCMRNTCIQMFPQVLKCLLSSCVWLFSHGYIMNITSGKRGLTLTVYLYKQSHINSRKLRIVLNATVTAFWRCHGQIIWRQHSVWRGNDLAPKKCKDSYEIYGIWIFFFKFQLDKLWQNW